MYQESRSVIDNRLCPALVSDNDRAIAALQRRADRAKQALAANCAGINRLQQAMSHLPASFDAAFWDIPRPQRRNGTNIITAGCYTVSPRWSLVAQPHRCHPQGRCASNGTVWQARRQGPLLPPARCSYYVPTMSHNRSHRAIVADVMRAPPSAYRDNHLVMDCGAPGCARGRTYRIADVAGVSRAETMGAMIRRLRCSMCDGPARQVVMRWTIAGRREWGELVLVGSAVR